MFGRHIIFPSVQLCFPKCGTASQFHSSCISLQIVHMLPHYIPTYHSSIRFCTIPSMCGFKPCDQIFGHDSQIISIPQTKRVIEQMPCTLHALQLLDAIVCSCFHLLSKSFPLYLSLSLAVALHQAWGRIRQIRMKVLYFKVLQHRIRIRTLRRLVA